MKPEISAEVEKVMSDKDTDDEQKRTLLNQIEKEHPQDVFIKTSLCSCGRMSVEVWFKHQEFNH